MGEKMSRKLLGTNLRAGEENQKIGAIQVKDEVWLCGGSTTDRKDNQSKSCKILNLFTGNWRTLENKMNLHRIKPVMFTDGSKVIVLSGIDSHPNNKYGCRNTQEVKKIMNQIL